MAGDGESYVPPAASSGATSPPPPALPPRNPNMRPGNKNKKGKLATAISSLSESMGRMGPSHGSESNYDADLDVTQSTLLDDTINECSDMTLVGDDVDFINFSSPTHQLPKDSPVRVSTPNMTTLDPKVYIEIYCFHVLSVYLIVFSVYLIGINIHFLSLSLKMPDFLDGGTGNAPVPEKPLCQPWSPMQNNIVDIMLPCSPRQSGGVSAAGDRQPKASIYYVLTI